MRRQPPHPSRVNNLYRAAFPDGPPLPDDEPAMLVDGSTTEFKSVKLAEDAQNKGELPPKNKWFSLAAWNKMGKRQRANLVIGAALVCMTSVVFIIALVSGSMPTAAGNISGVSGSKPASSVYNKNETPLPKEEFTGTILPETEDAGEEYVQDTLFLGDSNTVRMLNYQEVTGVGMNNAIGVVGMGIQAFPGLQCARFEGVGNVTMPQAVKIIQPRRVVITFGTNNVGSTSVDGFIESYQRALDAIEDAYPYADVIIGSVFPVDEYRDYPNISMGAIDKYNAALVALAEKNDCKFLNWSEALRDEETGYCKAEYTLSDGIHISMAGMEALFGYYRTHSYETEDNRPKPLDPVPRRLDPAPEQITSDPAKTQRSGQTDDTRQQETNNRPQRPVPNTPNSSPEQNPGNNTNPGATPAQPIRGKTIFTGLSAMLKISSPTAMNGSDNFGESVNLSPIPASPPENGSENTEGVGK